MWSGPISAHTGATVGHCPACTENAAAATSGLALAALVLQHTAVDDAEAELGEVAAWVASAHGPGAHGRCRECGGTWGGLESSLGYPAPCVEYGEIRADVNQILIGKVQQIMTKWQGAENE